MPRATVVFLAGLLLALPGLAGDDPPAAAPAPAGTWKVTLPTLRGLSGQPLWLLKFESKDGKWAGSLLDKTAAMPKTELSDVQVTADRLRFTLKAGDLVLPCDFKVVKGADVLRGSATIQGDVAPVELTASTVASLNAFELDKEALARKPLGVEAVQQALGLLHRAEAQKARPAEVRSWADKAARSAELYGPGWHREVLLMVAEALSEEKGYEAIGLQYAQRAERMLGPKETPAAQKRVLEVLANALEKAGKKEDAARVLVRLKKLDFRVKVKTYPGRKTKSDRVVLAELFTSSACEPCLAAEQAVDALGRTFKPSELLVLRYHLHAPKPDPLATADSEARAKFYEDAVERLPALLVSGKAAPTGPGGASEAQREYDDYYSAITPVLEMPARANVKVSATRKGKSVTITTEVSDLAETGDDVRLRVALVEDGVAYKGSNGLAVHNGVVRSLVGGEAGKVLKDKKAKETSTVDLEELPKKLADYLDKYAKKRPFPDKERPLELKKLRVVAFVQNDKTGEVLQAASAEVPEKE